MKALKIFQFVFALLLVMGFVVGSGLSNSSMVQASDKEKKERKEKSRIFRITNIRGNASCISGGPAEREEPRQIRPPSRPFRPRFPH